MNYNVTEFENFSGMISDSTLQLTFKKPSLTVMSGPWLYDVIQDSVLLASVLSKSSFLDEVNQSGGESPRDTALHVTSRKGKWPLGTENGLHLAVSKSQNPQSYSCEKRILSRAWVSLEADSFQSSHLRMQPSCHLDRSW